MNARTQCLSDFFPEDIPDDQECYVRNSVDKGPVNQYGKKFIDLCKEVPLHILNGRFIGDLLGNFTCMKYNEMSVVDYAAISPELINRINHFSVSNCMPNLSDHSAISLGLKINCTSLKN